MLGPLRCLRMFFIYLTDMFDLLDKVGDLHNWENREELNDQTDSFVGLFNRQVAHILSFLIIQEITGL